MKSIVKLQNRMKNEKGQGMVEYGLIIGFVAIALVFALTTLGTGLNGFFTDLIAAL